jgi:hypothetical protein
LAASLVIDNSIVMAWCFLNERNEYATVVRSFLGKNTAIQPVIWPLEAGNVVAVAIRRKRISHEDGSRFLSLLESLPIEVEAASPSRMFREVYRLRRNTNSPRMMLPISNLQCAAIYFSPRKTRRSQELRLNVVSRCSNPDLHNCRERTSQRMWHSRPGCDSAPTGATTTCPGGRTQRSDSPR